MNFSHLDAGADARRRPAPKNNIRLGAQLLRFAWFVLNMVLLVGATASFKTAWHYYNRMEKANQNDPFYRERFRNDDLRIVLYTIAGLLPLALGVTGEVKRLTMLEAHPQPPKLPAQERI